MRLIRLSLLVLGFALTSVLSQAAMAANIVETAADAGQFTTLIAAVKAAGLEDTLASSPHLTVFAPTDAAFAKLPKGTVESLLKPENKDKLRAILTYHVLGKKVLAEDIPHKVTPVKTLNGANVHVVRHGSHVRINKAHVIKADIRADNGVIHVINSVLIPPQH